MLYGVYMDVFVCDCLSWADRALERCGVEMFGQTKLVGWLFILLSVVVFGVCFEHRVKPFYVC